jgi:uncharacterized membrane protein
MTSQADDLVNDYLKRLSRELSDLPKARRRELEDEIEGHIVEARADLDAESEADIRNLLARLGDPATIAAEEHVRSGVAPRRAGAVEIFALIGLLIGGFVFLFGWFVGVILLWVSDAWSVREKLVGTLLVPGGLLPAFLIFSGAIFATTESCGSSSEIDPVTGNPIPGTFNEVCTGGPSLAAQIIMILIFVVCVVGPFFTTVFLARRMRRPAGSYQPSPGSV